MGEPDLVYQVIRTVRSGRQAGEPKHPSSPSKRNHRDSLSSGERRGKSLNLQGLTAEAYALWVL